MLEIIYRIYEVLDKNATLDYTGLQYYGCTNKEIIMDCKLVDDREQFKSIIKEEYGNDIKFRNSKNLKPGDLYCIIIGEHCYNTENYFVKITSKCSYCGCKLEGYFKPIRFDNYELDRQLYGIDKELYDKEMFCSHTCKNNRLNYLKEKLSKDTDRLENADIWVDKSLFSESQSSNKIVGYIYKITKRSTGEFYIGETTYVPIFRWGQHLITQRFPLSNIEDYIFEVIDTVYEGTNIFDVESKYIKEYYNKYPNLSLNIAGITEDMKSKSKSKVNKLF